MNNQELTYELSKLQKCSNMMEIQSIIMSDIYYKYCKLFASKFRPFNRIQESQEEWTKAMNKEYLFQIKKDRLLLFNSIPEKFKKSIMYNRLSEKLNSI